MSGKHLLPLFLFLTTHLSAQSHSATAQLRLDIVDPAGLPISGVAIRLTDPQRGYTLTGQSSPAGDFVALHLPPGTYNLEVSAASFQPLRLEGLILRVGELALRRLALTVAPQDTTLVVSATPTLLDPSRTQQANLLTGDRLTSLPINRRNYLDFALLAPGVVETTSLVDDASYRPVATTSSGLSLGGTNGRGNAFLLDGLELNLNGGGGVRPSLSQEAVAEFQINRNTFSAQFGQASGGVIQILSRSGANDWHGSLFGFLRHRSLQARNAFDPGKSAYTRTQVGASTGGALRRDRTFLFAAYETLQRQETSFIPLLTDLTVLDRLLPNQLDLLTQLDADPNFRSLSALARTALRPSASPFVSNLFTRNAGRFPFAQNQQQFSARLDHRFNARHQSFLRSNTTFDRQDNTTYGALDAFNRGRQLKMNDTALALGHLWTPAPNWVADFRALYGYNRFDITPLDPLGPELNINGFGLFGRQIFLPGFNFERHYQFVAHFARHSGKHTLNFGYDFNPVRNSSRNATFFGGRFTFGAAVPLATALTQIATQNGLAAPTADRFPQLNQPISSLQAAALGLPSLYQQGFGNPFYANTTFNHGFYLEDTIRLTRTLTLTPGLRYEFQAQTESLVPRDPNNFAPRLGLAWAPRNLVLRAGYGIFFSPLNNNIAGTAAPLSGRFINQILLTPASNLFTNPQTGTPVTSFTLFQAFQRQGIIGNRSILESDLTPFGITVGPNLPGSVLFGVSPDLVNPYAQQASLELETAWQGFTFSAAYNFNRAAKIARIRGRNVRYTGNFLPDGRPLFTRINPNILQDNVFESSANSFYHAGLFQVSRPLRRGFSLHAHYTFSRAIDEATDFNSDYSPQDQLNARAERSLSAFHQQHRVVFHALYERGGWRLAPIVSYNSWRPFNVLIGFDPQGDTYASNKRPAHLGRNAGQGPNFATFDLRLSRRIPFERYSLEVLAEGFNLLNRTNFRTINNIVGDVPIAALGSPITGNRNPASTPLAFTSALNSRQFQLALRFSF